MACIGSNTALSATDFAKAASFVMLPLFDRGPNVLAIPQVYRGHLYKGLLLSSGIAVSDLFFHDGCNYSKLW